MEAIDVFAIGERSLVVGDPAMKRLVEMVRERIAPADMPVLVQGETGTGKDVLASAMHAWSPRAEKPLVAINCAAMPEHLIESELFGFERGAFSGAISAKPGLMLEADGGALILDEIGELSLPVQAKLLRVLESRTVRPIGEVKERPIDIRIIAVTNRDLERDVEAGRFRRDLYYRLKGAVVFIPPLRHRKAEIVPLARFFLGRAPLVLSPDACVWLETRRWQGNVRELQALIRFAAATVSTGEILPEHCEAWGKRPRESLAPPPVQASLPPVPRASKFRPVAEEIAELERTRMSEALVASNGSRLRAAELIGMPRRTFATKLKVYGLAD